MTGMMSLSLSEMVKKHVKRTDCICGVCNVSEGEELPEGYDEDKTVDLVFFKLWAESPPEPRAFIEATKSWRGARLACNPLDGEEHNFIELGGWVGDPGIAMQYMGLGVLLGVFDLITPKTEMVGISDSMATQVALTGKIAIKAKEPMRNES